MTSSGRDPFRPPHSGTHTGSIIVRGRLSTRVKISFDERLGVYNPMENLEFSSRRIGKMWRLHAHSARELPQASAEERSVTRPQVGAEEASVAPEAGAEEGEDAARRLSRGCCAGHSRWTGFACVRCGGRRRVLAYVKQAGGVRAILEHLGLPTAGASLTPARAPPQGAGC